MELKEGYRKADTIPTMSAPADESGLGFRERERAAIASAVLPVTKGIGSAVSSVADTVAKGVSESVSGAAENFGRFVEAEKQRATEPFTPESVAVDTAEQVKNIATGDWKSANIGGSIVDVAETAVKGAADVASNELGMSDETIGSLGQLAQGIIASKFLNSVTGATQGTVGQAVKAPVVEAADIISSSNAAGSAASLPRPEESKKSAAQARFDSAVAQGGKKD